MHCSFVVSVADSTGGTFGPEETSGADKRPALPTASPPHALETCRRGLRNGNDIVITYQPHIYFKLDTRIGRHDRRFVTSTSITNYPRVRICFIILFALKRRYFVLFDLDLVR